MTDRGSIWGTVDGFDLPDRLRGFVVARDPAGTLLSGVRVEVQVCGTTVASLEPTRVRPDVSGDALHPAGWEVVLPDASLASLLTLGLVDVSARHPLIAKPQRLEMWSIIGDIASRHAWQDLASRLDGVAAAEILQGMSRSAALSEPSRVLMRRCSTILPRLEAGTSPASATADGEYGEVCLPVGITSADATCLLGRNGTIFLTEGSNAVLSRYTTPAAHMEHLSTDWIELFRARARTARLQNTRYIQLVIPEKISLLPDLFPIEVSVPTPLMARIDKECASDDMLGGCVIPMMETLQPVMPDGYFKTDSHLSPVGAWAVARAVLAHLGLDPPDIPFGVTEPYSGDLAAQIFGSPIRELARWPSGRLAKSRPDLIESVDPERGNTGRRRVWRTTEAPFDLVVVAFANSYFEQGAAAFNLSWWFARLFREFHFVWHGRYDAAYVGQVKPDVVVCQTVERFIFVTPPAQ